MMLRSAFRAYLMGFQQPITRDLLRRTHSSVSPSSRLLGSCGCGNIKITLVWPSSSPDTGLSSIKQFSPRRCDCSFCMKHGAAYVSHPEGEVTVQIKSPEQTRVFLQEGTDKQASFHLCSCCGVLSHVSHQLSPQQSIAAVNYRVFDNFEDLFAEPIVVSPQKLSTTQKIERWRQNWSPLSLYVSLSTSSERAHG